MSLNHFSSQNNSSIDYNKLYEYYRSYNQEHVFKCFGGMNETERQQYLKELSSINLEVINNSYEKNKSLLEEMKSGNKTHFGDIEPLPDTLYEDISDLDNNNSKFEKIKKWRELGLHLISQNQVAVILLAGGQGTRLGFEKPKGCYNIKLKSNKTLFQIQAERIKKLELLATNNNTKVTIPWFIMTSEATYNDTVTFFKEHDYFGLNAEQVRIFNQGRFPCLNEEGKILFKDKNQISYSPNGNGGIYEALIDSKILSFMNSNNINYVHLISVDNSLVKICDPVFIGFADSKKSQVAVKTVNKKSVDEQVGLVCLRNNTSETSRGQIQNSNNKNVVVVEYSEISPSLATKIDKDNKLVYGAANICNHLFKTSFLNELAQNNKQLLNKLEIHLAHKKIPFYDDVENKVIKPNKPNGYKLEMFVFDVFPFANINEVAVLQSNRSSEFSALKNGLDKDTDNELTCKLAIYNQGLQFLLQNNAIINDSNSKDVKCEIEISPLVSYEGEGLQFVSGRKLKMNAQNGYEYYFESMEQIKSAFE